MTREAEAPKPLKTDKGDKLKVGAALAAVYVIWSTTYLAIRIAVAEFPPFFMVGVRFVIAGAAMYFVFRRRGVKAPAAVEWRAAFITGTLLLGGNAGLVVAEQWVESGLAALVIAGVPFCIALLNGIWNQWPSGREWTGIAIGFAGIALLNFENQMRANPWGAVALMLAVVSWSLGTVLKRYLPIPRGSMATAVEMLLGGVVFSIVSLACGERLDAVPSRAAIIAFFYLLVFGSFVAFTAYDYLVRNVRPALASSYAYACPVFAVILGVTFAGEKLSSIGFVGMMIIVSGVVLMAWKNGSKDAAYKQEEH